MATLQAVWDCFVTWFFRLQRFLPGELRWFRPGRCTMCGEWGWVFWQTGEHEQCWLDMK